MNIKQHKLRTRKRNEGSGNHCHLSQCRCQIMFIVHLVNGGEGCVDALLT